jgi:hypothetical protein
MEAQMAFGRETLASADRSAHARDHAADAGKPVQPHEKMGEQASREEDVKRGDIDLKIMTSLSRVVIPSPIGCFGNLY